MTIKVDSRSRVQAFPQQMMKRGLRMFLQKVVFSNSETVLFFSMK
jgi:hypothetical protein